MLVVCLHPRIHTAQIMDNQIPYIFLMCKECGAEIARWRKPEDGKVSFEELLYQHLYIFGPVPPLSWAQRHELR